VRSLPNFWHMLPTVVARSSSSKWGRSLLSSYDRLVVVVVKSRPIQNKQSRLCMLKHVEEAGSHKSATTHAGTVLCLMTLTSE